MKIATYNVWNSANGMPYRKNHIVNEMKKVNADVWCLQEVCSREMAEYIAESTGYSYVYFESYEKEEEGLCIASHLPLKEREAWFGKVNAIWASFSYAEAGHTVAEATLNFRENPRFRCNTIEVNSRYDRILLRNTYPCAFPILKKCTVFGQTVYRKTNLAASDHYGVVVEMEGG